MSSPGPVGRCPRPRAASRTRGARRAPRAWRASRHRSAGPPWARRRRPARAHRRSDSAPDPPLRARGRCRAEAAPRRTPRRIRAHRELQAEQVASRSIRRALRPPGRAPGPRLQRFARARVDQRRARREHPLEQQLDPAAAFLRAANPRGHDARVVEHQQVVRAQQPRKLAEIEVAPQPARAVERSIRLAPRVSAGRCAISSVGSSK